MTDKQFAWEKALVLLFIAYFILGLFVNLSNADISFPALATGIIVLLIAIGRRHHVSR